MKRSVLALLVGAGLAVVACGSSSSHGGSGGGDGGSDATSDDSSGSSSGSASSSSGSSSGSASSSSGSGSSSGGDGGSKDGGSTDGAPTDGGPSDGGSGGTCGTTSCMAPQLCCVTPGDGGTGFDFNCVAGGCMGVSLACAATADCGMGQVCCLAGSGRSSMCAAKCGGNNTQLCDPNAANNGGCPQGTTCQAGGVNGLPMTYGTCQ